MATNLDNLISVMKSAAMANSSGKADSGLRSAARNSTQEIDVSPLSDQARAATASDGEMFVTFKLVKLPAATAWAPAGHVLAWEQFAWPGTRTGMPAEPPAGLQAACGSDVVVIGNARRFFRISGRTGLPDLPSERARIAGHTDAMELLAGPDRQ